MEKTQTPSIFHVARKIVELTAGTLTPLKLQKLAYYCQAWSLAWEERPLFNEEFQAWANGPVCPELYEKHKGTYVVNGDFLAEFTGFSFNERDSATIQKVLSFYGNRDPFELSELTHKERPWREARGSTPSGESSTALITKDSMQDYYAGIATT